MKGDTRPQAWTGIPHDDDPARACNKAVAKYKDVSHSCFGCGQVGLASQPPLYDFKCSGNGKHPNNGSKWFEFTFKQVGPDDGESKTVAEALWILWWDTSGPGREGWERDGSPSCAAVK